MTAVIFVTLALVGVGIVVDALFRLRNYLQRPPPSPDVHDPPEDEKP